MLDNADNLSKGRTTLLQLHRESQKLGFKRTERIFYKLSRRLGIRSHKAHATQDVLDIVRRIVEQRREEIVNKSVEVRYLWKQAKKEGYGKAYETFRRQVWRVGKRRTVQIDSCLRRAYIINSLLISF